MSRNQENALSIGDVVRATGVSEATLRAWERRYGFPRPSRQPSGHRRYSADQVSQVTRVASERQRGISLGLAIERAQAPSAAAASIFAGLRERHPDLLPMTLSKRHVLALARAVEDESAARGERGLLVGCFQRERFYRQSEDRWRDLAQGTELSFVFAAFGQPRRPSGGPVEIAVDPARPLAREWGVVCLAPEHGACLIGWEPPGRAPAGDGERELEVLLSVDPTVVRESAEAAAALAAPSEPELAAATRSLVEGLADPDPGSQLRLSSAITARALAGLRAGG